MILLMDGFEPSTVHVRIALGRDDAGVAKQLLDGPQVSAPLQEMRRKRVPQRMGTNPLRDAPHCRAAPEDLPHALPRQPFPATVQKEGRRFWPTRDEPRPFHLEIAPQRLEGLVKERLHPEARQGKAHLASGRYDDARAAFEPLTPVHFTLDRLETNPRFAAIARPANAAILVKLRIDMEDRGGRIELLLPYATLEPIRKMLLQQFMGEKFGRDNIWEGHLATELWTTETEVRAVLDEQQVPLSKVLDLKVGDTLMLNATPDSDISVRCGSIPVTTGKMGRKGQNIAVRVEAPISIEAATSLTKGRR